MSSRIIASSLLGVALLAACGPPRARTRPAASPAEAQRWALAYRAAAECMDSVASLAGYDVMPKSDAARRSPPWSIAASRFAGRAPGSEYSNIAASFALVPGRDMLVLTSVGASSGRYVNAEGAHTVDPAPAPIATAAAQRVKAGCASVAFSAPS